jgi:hypothetical protein
MTWNDPSALLLLASVALAASLLAASAGCTSGH